MAVVASYDKWAASSPDRAAAGQAGYQRYLQNMAAINARQGQTASQPSPTSQSQPASRPAPTTQTSTPQRTSKGVVASYQNWAASSPARASAGQEGYQRYLQNMGVTGGGATTVQGAPASSGGPVRTDPIRWKPVSEKDGRLVVLANNSGPMRIIGPDGNVIATGRNEGPSNGYGATVRFDRPGSSLPPGSKLQIGNTIYNIPNPGQNYHSLSTGGGGTPSQGFGGRTAAISAGSSAIPPGAVRMKISSQGLSNFGEGGNDTVNLRPGEQAYFERNGKIYVVTNTHSTTRTVGVGVYGPAKDVSGITMPTEEYRGSAPAPTPLNTTGGGGGHFSGGGGGGGSGGGGGGGGSGGVIERPQITADTKDAGPFTRKVKKEETVQHQMTELLDKNNAYMRQAETFGLQRAAQRGLLNTSMAVQSAEAARVAAALPIAQQDASTYFSQAINNQNTVNQFNMANLTAINQADLAALDQMYRERAMELAHAFELENMSVANGYNTAAEYRNYVMQIMANPNFTTNQQQSGVNFANVLYSRAPISTRSYTSSLPQSSLAWG